MRVKNVFSRCLFEDHYEVFKLPSMTVPDQAMTVRQIMDRFARGLPLGSPKMAMYDDDINEDDPEYIPDPKYMDLAERQEMKESFEYELSELKKRKNVKKNEFEKTLGDGLNVTSTGASEGFQKE